MRMLNQINSPADVKRLKQLEAENAELKKMYAEMCIENRAIKAVLEKKF